MAESDDAVVALSPGERERLEAELVEALGFARAQLSLIRGSLATAVAYAARPT